MTKFYRKTLRTNCANPYIYTTTYVSIHETECYHFCIEEYNLSTLNYMCQVKSGSKFHVAKNSYISIRKIAKEGSRIAASAEDKAMEQLIRRKNHHLSYIRRDMTAIRNFLNNPNKYKD